MRLILTLSESLLLECLLRSLKLTPAVLRVLLPVSSFAEAHTYVALVT